MRTNLPVSQQEYQFPAAETLLSTTDTKSNITYANAAFIRTSGYAVHELVGQPHNMVRHPDMPAEAFEDMWRTLKDGQSWRALVKNRRQNGDHYWVCANAAPMRRNGVLTGYLSVRTHPQRNEVDAATQLYARIKAGRATGLAFHRGLVVRTGLMRWASTLQLMPTAWRVRLPLLGVGLVAGSAMVLAGVGSEALLASGATLACLLLFEIPARRRRWRTLLGMFALLALLTGGLVSCVGKSKSNNGNSGTTAGSYTITVTGTFGSTTATTAVNLTVN